MKFLSLILLMALASITRAQHLPTIQDVGKWKPSNLKIDGKTKEWGNTFGAYNKGTDLYYTLANDDDYLYLLVQAKNADNIKKIMMGGITLTVNNQANKSDAIISYPVLSALDATEISKSFITLKKSDSLRTKTIIDSAKKAKNTKFTIKAIYVRVEGIKEITDTLLSVYNDQGIEASGAYDSDLNYNYELKLPLKYLGVSEGSGATLDYKVTLNGVTPKDCRVQLSGRGLYILTFHPGGGDPTITPNTPQNMLLAFPSELSGQYKMQKNIY